ncbi:uncharacterized protein LOC128885014 [Hylaeus volcanicus]|uniref:uncharacterized protein LOC128885014 n=1 Tax=Hylaeus volcanicus TaxID=313075 RepID=UPI0023B7BA00|nr:uncharacterized protein LOC128885014 [Hylaeus volcanicus]
MNDSCMEAGVAPDESQELPFPEGPADQYDDDDADSHGKESSINGRIRRAIYEIPMEEADFNTTYPMANSHGNAYQESSSHSRYSELYSELAVRNYLDANRDDAMNYSVANSHGDHSVSSENRERSIRENTETDQQNWDRQYINYEVANSHSNYRVYYDSQTQPSGWPIESWNEQLQRNPCVAEDKKQKSANTSNVDVNTSRNRPERSESEPCSEPGCDIEQCLVQIEESLMNIEQNLLHVQDLDIPELRNLLYKSPSIEKSLFEVQDLLYADGIVPAIKKRKSLSLESEEENEDEDDEEEEEEEEVCVYRNLTVKDNDDEDGDAGAGPFDASNEESSDTANAEESNQSGSVDDHSKIFREENANSNYTEKAMNFIPNSLNKTLPRRVLLDGTKENIRLCSSGPEEQTIVDYNLNTTCAEKKLFCRDKCHSRTNSLDENSAFPNLDSGDKHETGKSSLQNLLFEPRNGNSLDLSVKARSEEILQTPRERFSKALNRRGIDDKRWTIVEAKTEDFRRKIESIASHRRLTVSAGNDQRRTKASKEAMTENVTRSREKSPARSRRGAIAGDRSQEKEKDSGKAFDKRKRKKISSRGQSSSENALVPSKLISLSLSILLAALLQAVRCLTDLVEDAFRSVSYDRNGLLQ